MATYRIDTRNKTAEVVSEIDRPDYVNTQALGDVRKLGQLDNSLDAYTFINWGANLIGFLQSGGNMGGFSNGTPALRGTLYHQEGSDQIPVLDVFILDTLIAAINIQNDTILLETALSSQAYNLTPYIWEGPHILCSGDSLTTSFMTPVDWRRAEDSSIIHSGESIHGITLDDQADYYFSIGERNLGGIWTSNFFRGDTCDMIATSVTDQTAENPLKVYPNPTNWILNVTSSVNMENEEIRIYDQLGRIALIERIDEGDWQPVDVSGLSPGIYHVNILGQSQRFIKLGE
jgi:hypothetical protein